VPTERPEHPGRAGPQVHAHTTSANARARTKAAPLKPAA
jgi:hypothetical protein